MKLITFLLPVSLSAVLFSGCEKTGNLPDGAEYSDGIYIVNEGSFQNNNGSISFFDPDAGSITNGIFEAVNGRPLGDVVQSFATVGDTTGIIVVNGSAKFEVVYLRTFSCIAEPVPVTYPRYFKQVTSAKGYLTAGSMQGFVYKIDLVTLNITDSIRVGNGPDALVERNGMVYVANSGGWGIDSTVHVISAHLDQIIDTFHVGKAPADLVFDGSGNLWIYCRGYAVYSWDPPYNLISETDALLQKVDITLGAVLWQGTVGRAGDYTASPPRIAASPDGDFIYFLRPEGVYKCSAGNPEISDVPLITGSFYGMDVNPEDGSIFVFESVFTGNGTMKIYTEDGMLLGEGMVGIAPNGAVFR